MEIRLGESIRRLRKKSGFTQEQLAEALENCATFDWMLTEQEMAKIDAKLAELNV